MVLLWAEGVPLRQIGVRVGMEQHQGGVWRRRFAAERLEGLEDRPRPGRPRRLGHDERMRVAAVATSERDPADPVATRNSLQVTEALRAEGMEISVSQVWRICAIGGPTMRAQVVDAHDAAVAAVIDWIERHAHTRYRVNGEVCVFDAGGIMAAAFRQHTSRALDPQLHTHA